jgi:hypothetical protein
MTSIAPDNYMRGTKLMETEEIGTYLHWCPGCKRLHPINTQKHNAYNAIWSFDGNIEQPTFSPSINLVGYCHYFITAGKILYCTDTKHEFSGQTIDLPDIPIDERW